MTQTPWRLEAYENTISEMGIRVVNANGNLVCDDEPFYPHPVSFANARLIASAPDLLEALVALVDEYCDYQIINNLGDPENQHNIKLARAAIAKAKGGAS